MKLNFGPILIVAILLLTTSCASTSLTRNPELKIENSYENLTFKPGSIVKEIEPNLFVTVKPVDAVVMDSITTFASLRTGAYENSISNSFTTANRAEGSLTPKQEQLLDVTNRLIAQIESGAISESLAISLINRMWEGPSVGSDGTELESVPGSVYSSEYNPFYYNRNYLSVFELTLENRTDRVQTISVNDFQITNGNESMRPYSNDFMMDRLVNDERIDNLNRYNLPDAQTIAPEQTIRKFIAVPAIRESSKSVNVQVIRSSENFSEYKFEVTRNSVDGEITLVNYVINPVFFLGSNALNVNRYEKFYSVQFENGQVISLKDDSFYVPKESLNQKVRLCYAAVASSSSYTPRFSCVSLNLQDYEDGIID